MNLDEGATVSYQFTPKNVLREFYPAGTRDVLHVSSSARNRYSHWAFKIVIAERPNAWGMELHMTQWHGWIAFEQAPEIFAALAKLDAVDQASAFDVIKALEEVGVVEDKREW